MKTKKPQCVMVMLDPEFYLWIRNEAKRLKLEPETYLHTLALMDRRVKERGIVSDEPDAGDE